MSGGAPALLLGRRTRSPRRCASAAVPTGRIQVGVRAVVLGLGDIFAVRALAIGQDVVRLQGSLDRRIKRADEAMTKHVRHGAPQPDLRIAEAPLERDP